MRYKIKQISGFTLIELLVTVVIIGILTAIAYPNYTQYVNNSKVTDGQQAISAAMASLEQTYLDNRVYPGTDAITDSSNYFTYAYTQAGAPLGQAYYIRALGNGPLAADYIAANNADVRCVCLNCTAGNPFSGFTDATTACPAGSTAW